MGARERETDRDRERKRDRERERNKIGEIGGRDGQTERKGEGER